MSVHRESNYADGGLDGLADTSIRNRVGHYRVQGGKYHHDNNSDPVFHLLRSVPIANPRFKVKTLEVALFVLISPGICRSTLLSLPCSSFGYAAFPAPPRYSSVLFPMTMRIGMLSNFCNGSTSSSLPASKPAFLASPLSPVANRGLSGLAASAEDHPRPRRRNTPFGR